VNVLRELDQLRDLFAQPGTGAWFTATARLDREGRISFDFDYDNEPQFSSAISEGHYFEEWVPDRSGRTNHPSATRTHPAGPAKHSRGCPSFDRVGPPIPISRFHGGLAKWPTIAPMLCPGWRGRA
jgi:hypothetical protein